MKVLFLMNLPTPYRIDFFDALSKHCELTVLFERRHADNRDDAWLSKRSENYQTVFLNGIKSGEENALSFDVLKYLKKNKYDLIVIGGYATPTAMMAIFWMKLKRVPYVLNADGGYIKPDSGFKKAMKSFFIKGASAWICTGESVKGYFAHYGADPGRTYIYPFSSMMAADMPKALPSGADRKKARKALDISEEKTVLAVGQFIPRKGFDILLRAWHHMPPEYGLYIVGDVPTIAYESLKDSLRLKNVHFAGFMGKEQLSRYYTAADVFVLPTREDIWGLVIGEAMAFGLPVITTTACVAGIELVDASNGFLVEAENIEALHSAIKKVLSDKTDIAALRQNSFNKIKPYTIENMADRHVEIFHNLTK